MTVLTKRVKAKSKNKQQQKQTIITSKTLCLFEKTTLNDKNKIATDKTEIKQNNLQFAWKDMRKFHITAC